ncbi:MAG: hypothetical protein U0271_45185 [Polyangiaceae bacterium]
MSADSSRPRERTWSEWFGLPPLAERPLLAKRAELWENCYLAIDGALPLEAVATWLEQESQLWSSVAHRATVDALLAQRDVAAWARIVDAERFPERLRRAVRRLAVGLLSGARLDERDFPSVVALLREPAVAPFTTPVLRGLPALRAENLGEHVGRALSDALANSRAQGSRGAPVCSRCADTGHAALEYCDCKFGAWRAFAENAGGVLVTDLRAAIALLRLGRDRYALLFGTERGAPVRPIREAHGDPYEVFEVECDKNLALIPAELLDDEALLTSRLAIRQGLLVSRAARLREATPSDELEARLQRVELDRTLMRLRSAIYERQDEERFARLVVVAPFGLRAPRADDVPLSVSKAMRELKPTVRLDDGKQIELRSLSALAPDALVAYADGGSAALRRRNGLTGLKRPVGSDKSFRQRLGQALLAGEALRLECSRVLGAYDLGGPLPDELPLLESLGEAFRIARGQEGFDVVMLGFAVVCTHALDRRLVTIDKPLVDALIAELDRELSHSAVGLTTHARVREVEASWRGLELMLAPVANLPPGWRAPIVLDLVDADLCEADSLDLAAAPRANRFVTTSAVLAGPRARALRPRLEVSGVRVIEEVRRPIVLRDFWGSEELPVKGFDYASARDRTPLVGDGCWLPAQRYVEGLISGSVRT